jgi:hypothetical protein
LPAAGLFPGRISVSSARVAQQVHREAETGGPVIARELRSPGPPENMLFTKHLWDRSKNNKYAEISNGRNLEAGGTSNLKNACPVGYETECKSKKLQFCHKEQKS